MQKDRLEKVSDDLSLPKSFTIQIIHSQSICIRFKMCNLTTILQIFHCNFMHAKDEILSHDSSRKLHKTMFVILTETQNFSPAFMET